MKESKMCEFATYCMKGLEKATVNLDWIGALIGWLAMNFLAILFCLFTWPFALYLWITGGEDEQPK
jgi:hypothetical protein